MKRMKMEKGELENSIFVTILDMVLLNLFELFCHSLNKKLNLDDAREFLYSLQNKESQSNDRGPFLAELELEKRVVSSKKEIKPAKEIETLVIEYARKFGEKSSCFEDLKPYLKDFSLETSKKFIEEFKASIDNNCEDEKVNKIFFESSIFCVL